MTNPIVPAMQTLLDQLRMQNGEDDEDVKTMMRTLTKYTNAGSESTTPMTLRNGTIQTQSTSMRHTNKNSATPFYKSGLNEHTPTPQQAKTAAKGFLPPINLGRNFNP